MRKIFTLLGILMTAFPIFSQNLDNKTFIIQSKSPKVEGKVIEADYTTLGKNGAKIHLRELQHSRHQTWKFEALFDGLNLYHIINQSSKAGKYKYLEAAWTTLDLDIGKLQLWEFNDGVNGRYSAHQIWQVRKNSNGYYSILSAHPKSKGKSLEVDPFFLSQNGAKILLYFDVQSENQLWDLVEDK